MEEKKETTTRYIGFCHLENELILEIGEFAIWWNSFEGQCLNCNCNYESIQKFAEKIKDKDEECFKEFSNVLKQRAKIVCGDNDSALQDYIKTKLYPSSDKRSRLNNKEKTEFPNKVMEFVHSGGTSCLEGALLAIWRIRNNMFHGLKENFNIELFKAMNAVLNKIYSINWE